ncbi:NAD-dependent epimerase/dehydratase family protein [Phaeocystidibacter luteus]|uniref:Epimerase n=1 Tax=Phaeocystidibacter luteus TaxID=911197 RepID=A0A6N6RL23_9FLAO|nr:NAD-dependent epimerase/dehydratase family protein [Phaeocystidibacter luteus]KAB2810177.1 epimerase [Phaeocystidibacter luteus]
MKVVITGATGMIGKGVLLECLDNPSITEVLTIGRSSLDVSHDKLREMRLQDLRNLSEHNDSVRGYDACFFCMGVSFVGMTEEAYTEVTYDMAVEFGQAFKSVNPKATFVFVSGAGTDASESGRQMWARVKGKAENALLGMGFPKAYMFRPGMIIPERGITSRTRLYRNMYILFRPFFPLFRRMNSVVSTGMIGKAMIALVDGNRPSGIINPKDMRELAGTS